MVMDIIIGLERNVKTNSIKKSTLYDMVEYIKMYRSSEDITYYRKIMATARELSKQLCGSESLWLRFTDFVCAIYGIAGLDPVCSFDNLCKMFAMMGIEVIDE